MQALRPGLFDEWLEYERLEPFGFPLTNLLQAYALATLSNTVGGGKAVSKTKREPYQLHEFLLKTGQRGAPPARRLSRKATVDHVSAVFALLGVQGKPLRESGG